MSQRSGGARRRRPARSGTRSGSAGHPEPEVARATKRAAIVSWWSLLGASRPTESHRGPVPSRRSVSRSRVAGSAAGGGTATLATGITVVRAHPARRSSSASKDETPIPSAARSQLAELRQGTDLEPRDGVVPAREELWRGDAVVVEHQRLRASGSTTRPEPIGWPPGRRVRHPVRRPPRRSGRAGSPGRCPGRAARCRCAT